MQYTSNPAGLGLFIHILTRGHYNLEFFISGGKFQKELIVSLCVDG